MNRRRPNSPDPVRLAFTLLEVLLALGLSVVVMAIVVAAIQLNLQMLEDRRSRVEEVQLAHAVLQRIAGDLRATLSRQTADLSALESMAGGVGDLGALPEGELPGGELPDDGELPDAGGETPTGEGAGSGAGGGSGEGMGSGDEAALADALAGATGSTDEAPATSTPPGPPPGIYGSGADIQVDVSRLPRLDEYEGTWDAETGVTAPPSDVKTVTYFLLPPPDAIEEEEIGETPRYGLMRYEMGRAAAHYQSESGAVADMDEASESLCPEVDYLEFRYFDGTAWATEWDTEAKKGLPRAVEVTIRMRDDSDADAGEVAEDELARTYRMVVQVPLAANNAAFEDPAATADEEAPDAPDAPAEGDDAEPPPTGDGGEAP